MGNPFECVPAVSCQARNKTETTEVKSLLMVPNGFSSLEELQAQPERDWFPFPVSVVGVGA